MKKDWKYILYLVIAVGLFALVKMASPSQYDWTVTFAHDDKNPYGAFALYNLLPELFKDRNINHSYETIYEIKDSLHRKGSIFILSGNFGTQEEDANALLKHVAAGGSAFISSRYFWGTLSDTLKFNVADHVFSGGETIFNRQDSTTIRFVHPAFDTTVRFHFMWDNIPNYFSEFDTTTTSVIARNSIGNPVTVRIRWGKGNFILNSTPMAFTNIYMLAKNNHEFASGCLSFLPVEDVQWTEYYHLGRMESRTPLRYILLNEPLRWAYFITLLSLLLFMLFELKRRQRIIPVIKPLANTSLEFVTTIGNLYYQSGEHRSIAEKKILYLLEQIRTRYWMSTSKIDDVFIETLSRKTGKPREDVQKLFGLISSVRAKKQITAGELTNLNEQIERFTH